MDFKGTTNKDYEQKPTIMDNSIVERMAAKEKIKAEFYSQCYQSLPKEKHDLLLNLRPEIQQKVVQYIRGEILDDELPEEEQELVKRLQYDYQSFLQNHLEEENSDISYQLNLNHLDNIIYSNFLNRIAFKILENRENLRDKQAAREIANRLGLEYKPEVNN